MSTTFSVDEAETVDHDAFIARFNKYIAMHPLDTIYSDDAKLVFEYVRSQSNHMVIRNHYAPWLIEALENEVFLTFYCRYIQLLCCNNGATYLERPRNKAVASFIKLQMLVWNTTHNIQALNFKLNSTRIPYNLIQLLKYPHLSPSVCQTEQNVRLIVHSTIGVLHNIITHIPQSRGQFRNFDAVQVFTMILNGFCEPNGGRSIEQTIPSLSLRTAALLCLSSLVNEDENEKLHTSDIHILYLLEALKDALSVPTTLYSTTYGFGAIELLAGLQNLAGPDSNKATIVQLKGVSIVETGLIIATKMKESQSQEDEASTPSPKDSSTISPDKLAVAVLSFLWMLTFIPDTHLSLVPGSDFRRLFERFATEPRWSSECRKVAQGILWTLNSSAEPLPGCDPSSSIHTMMGRDRRHRNPSGHLMISYQHSTQAIMLKVREELVKRGYRLWMDVDITRKSDANGR